MYLKFLILVLSVILTSSQNISERNFNSDCGQVYTQKQFIIESPNYPSNYPLSFECSYLLKGLSCPTRFSLQFLDFSLEESLGCSKDRLEIDDKDALCGNRYANEVKEYFSDKGTLALKFISDGSNTARGYRILINRSGCLSEHSTTTDTNRDVEYTTKPSSVSSRCCSIPYNSKKITVTSPNFPYSMSTPVDCLYEIHKFNEDICRLRISMKFFWLSRNNNCYDGFLQIDGSNICGCKSELTAVIPFEEQNAKTLRFLSKGYERSSYSGFVMDIFQENCPTKIVPEEKYFKNQTSRLIDAEKLHLIAEDKQRSAHLYFFAPEFVSYPRNREETDYINTSDQTNYNYCRNWNQFQFNMLSLNELPVCKTNTNEGNVVSRNCIELDQQKGYFSSPGYPYYYPRNSNICYRFHKLPGFCTIQVHMKDFNLQSSPNCDQDYVFFPNQLRYCGNHLTNTVFTLDMRNKLNDQMTFISDAFYCGRGFFGQYEQIPCPISPNVPTSTCSKTTQEEMFKFDVEDYDANVCSLLVKKHSENVCAVRLDFENFDLVCTSESLVVGGTMYCGRLSGQSVTIDVTNGDLLIVYRRKSNAEVRRNRLSIKGRQLSDNCQYPEVPAERYFNGNLANNTQFLLKMNRNFKEICGLVTNVTISEPPETFCDLIMKSQNITACVPLKNNSLSVPVGSRKVELNIQNVEKVRNVEFKVVDCKFVK